MHATSLNLLTEMKQFEAASYSEERNAEIAPKTLK